MTYEPLKEPEIADYIHCFIFDKHPIAADVPHIHCKYHH